MSTRLLKKNTSLRLHLKGIESSRERQIWLKPRKTKTRYESNKCEKSSCGARINSTFSQSPKKAQTFICNFVSFRFSGCLCSSEVSSMIYACIYLFICWFIVCKCVDRQSEVLKKDKISSNCLLNLKLVSLQCFSLK